MASSSPSRRILLLSIVFLVMVTLGILFGRAYSRQSSHREVKSVGPDGQPIHAQARGESAASHIKVQGDYQVDKDTHAFCTLNVDKAFQVTWRGVVPEVVMRIENFKGAGDYDAEIRVRATYTGESYRTSKGMSKVSIQGTPAASGSLLSGSFSTDFKGESGKGSVSGSFERCPYALTEPTTL